VQAGAPTIDVIGGPGVPTQGSFDGSHIYADNGVYTVTVTVVDDDGGVAVQTFEVTVNNVAPTLVVAPDQVVNEGALLAITNIGQFTDPGFNNPLNVGGETTEQFSYSIDWGDGTPVQAGAPTIDVIGGPGVPTQGSFDGSHIYADNGVYTVTVTVVDDDGGVAVQRFEVTVNNVAPTVVVAPRQVDEGALLSIPNIAQFTDPGFDNPLNLGGETTEQFSYTIDWGDGSPGEAGVPTIDVPGSPGLPTQGSFDGSHIYADNGVYKVTITVADDDGGVTVTQFEVTVNNVAPSVVAPGNQVVNEGQLISLPNIGQFTDPGFDNPLNPGGPTTERFTYSINWGDGTATQVGPATIDAFGSAGVPMQGSFDGSHTYADNGVYTVTVKAIDDDGGVGTATFTITVNNVAPTLTLGTGDVSIPLTETLTINDLGLFDDPGFDNLLNVGGETTERFTFSVNWGDGTPNTGGPATIDVPGAIGLRTSGSFDASHLYGAPGEYTVTVTLADDDGGFAVAQFEVTVFVLRPTIIVFPPGGAGGGTPTPPPSSPAGGAVLPPPASIVRSDLKGLRAAAVAGAEPRLVLRVVTPDGEEDQPGEQQLDDEVLDNLRALFRRLPDGHYRIYQIQPDGIERLVVDVVVRQGRAIQLEDDFTPTNDLEAVDPNAVVPPDDAPAEDAPAPGDAKDRAPAGNETSLSELPLPAESLEPARDEAAESQLAAVGVAAALPLGRLRNPLRHKPTGALPLIKAHRILRRR
jgi:PKD repeat protein